jgi:hypothetical protein
VLLTLKVQEELVETRAARRLEIDLKGTARDGGVLALEIRRAGLEMREKDGRVHGAASDDPVPVAGPGTSEDADARRLLAGLVGHAATIVVDPRGGLARCEGFDRALDAAAGTHPSLADLRVSLATSASDAALRRSLSAAGLGAPRRARDDRTAAERSVAVFLPGLGETAMPLAGEFALDERRLPAVRWTGALVADPAFSGVTGAAPPAEFGTIDVGRVRGTATTSWRPEGGIPVRGEWTLDVPYSRGPQTLTLRTSTSFLLVVP